MSWSQTMSVVLQTGNVAAVTITSLNPGAGARGERSVNSTMQTLEGALPAWTATPGGSLVDGTNGS